MRQKTLYFNLKALLGFTLIETLVALLVMAISKTAAIQAAALHVATAAHLKDGTFAHWVALNTAAELQ